MASWRSTRHLTIAADGRHSTLRDGAGFEVVEYGAPMDVLWLRLSKGKNDPGQTLGRMDAGRIFIMLDRNDYWQCAFVIPKGGIDEVHARGLDAFRAEIARLAPYLTDRVQELATWDDVKLLTVAVNRLNTWFRPGLLCIGDAAHAMSPVGGVGINLAIQDAVAAANILVPRLREGGVTLDDLRAVQRRREPPTRMTQRVQVAIQNRIISNVLRGATTPKPPLAVRHARGVPAAAPTSRAHHRHGLPAGTYPALNPSAAIPPQPGQKHCNRQPRVTDRGTGHRHQPRHAVSTQHRDRHKHDKPCRHERIDNDLHRPRIDRAWIARQQNDEIHHVAGKAAGTAHPEGQTREQHTGRQEHCQAAAQHEQQHRQIRQPQRGEAASRITPTITSPQALAMLSRASSRGNTARGCVSSASTSSRRITAAISRYPPANTPASADAERQNADHQRNIGKPPAAHAAEPGEEHEPQQQDEAVVDRHAAKLQPEVRAIGKRHADRRTNLPQIDGQRAHSQTCWCGRPHDIACQTSVADESRDPVSPRNA